MPGPIVDLRQTITVAVRKSRRATNNIRSEVDGVDLRHHRGDTEGETDPAVGTGIGQTVSTVTGEDETIILQRILMRMHTVK